MFHIHLYNNFTPLKWAFHAGSFLRVKYMRHSAYISVSVWHHQIDLVLEWRNRNPQAKY